MSARERQRCENCNCFVDAVLSKRVCGNGAQQAYWRCPNGDHCTRKNSQNVSHRILKELGVSLDDLPVIRDDKLEVVCEVVGCERPGFENHHWARLGVYPDAPNWPQSALCKYHHDLWHKTEEQYWRTRIDLERHGISAKRDFHNLPKPVEKGRRHPAGEVTYGDE